MFDVGNFMLRFRQLRMVAAVLPVLVVVPTPVSAQVDYPTKFSNTGSVINTRHNMTQRNSTGGAITGPNGTLQSNFMDIVRNDYREVCVYCHTPHGANANISVPLWNRAIVAPSGGYQTYNQLGTNTLTQPVSQPGANSLACLSCHDGQTAIDAIINMPGSGRFYDGSLTQKIPDSFLNSWGQLSQSGGGPASSHQGLPECASCHAISGTGVPGATSFKTFLIGTDLRDDHPVGIRFPSGASDFFQPAGVSDRAIYFDNNGNNRMDKDEIRLYKTGTEFQVECASCHDPHGVPSLGAGTEFNKTFLRVTNDQSKVCLTCHNK